MEFKDFLPTKIKYKERGVKECLKKIFLSFLHGIIGVASSDFLPIRDQIRDQIQGQGRGRG